MFDLTTEQLFDMLSHMDRTPVRVTPGPYGHGSTALRLRRATAVASQEAGNMAKLTTPARVVVLLTAIAVLLVLLLANAVGASVSDDTTGFTTHQVVGGDTLWDIASEHTVPGEDVRRVVFEIQRLNDLDGSVIIPGQVLRVPIPG